MRKFLKHAAQILLVPFFRWYLRKERRFDHDGFSIKVYPGVFHPGFFSSTLFLLDHLKSLPLSKVKMLELGCGTALISIAAAKRGAEVTASDISTLAIQNTKANILSCNVSVSVMQSDLFDSIEGIFDLIVINPPYYPRPITREADAAWYCGENFEYFKKLFLQLKDHIHEDSEVLMVLTKGCDLETIFSIAHNAGFQFTQEKEKDVLFDQKDFLYSIEVKSSESVPA